MAIPCDRRLLSLQEMYTASTGACSGTSPGRANCGGLNASVFTTEALKRIAGLLSCWCECARTAGDCPRQTPDAGHTDDNCAPDLSAYRSFASTPTADCASSTEPNWSTNRFAACRSANDSKSPFPLAGLPPTFRPFAPCLA